MKRAEEKGATIINHTKSVHFTYDSNEQVNGIQVEDQINNETYPVKAKKLSMQVAHGRRSTQW